MMWRCKNFS